jgi:hypothetical protein
MAASRRPFRGIECRLMAVVEEYSEVYAGKVTAGTEVSVGSSEGNLRRRAALVCYPAFAR